MKNRPFLLLCLCLLFFYQITFAQEEDNFSLHCHIEGLLPGDTLLLSSVALPYWDMEKTDTLIVRQADYHILKKHIPHTTFYLFSHLPGNGIKKETCMRGETFLVTPGDNISIKGNADYIGALDISGGFYEHPLIARYDSLDNSYHRELIDIYRKMAIARNAQQEDSIKKYNDMYHGHRAPSELKELRKYLLEEVSDMEFSVFLYLQSFDMTIYEAENRYNKYNQEVKNSYMGKLFKYMQRVLKNIEVGNQPNNFTVTDKIGNTIRLSDYRGKYVLIYNWGICPGVLGVHPKILELYDKYNAVGFEIIGFTTSDFLEANPELSNDPELAILYNQPWTTVYTENNDNTFITKDYYFAGTPILMLISPDGTTLARGYNEVFEPIINILEENLGNK